MSSLLLAAVALPGWSDTLEQEADGWPVLPEKLDLKTALELALEHNPGLKETRERLLEQNGAIRELEASKRPKVDVNSNYTRFDPDRQQSFGSGSAPDDSRWQGDAEASIVVFSGGRYRSAIRRELTRKQAVVANLAAAEQELLAEIHERYYDAELAEEQVQVQQDAIQLLEEQLKYARNRYDAGTGARFDVMQAEVAVANAKPPLIRAQNDYRRNVDALRRAMGVVFPVGKEADDIHLQQVAKLDELDLQLEPALLAASEQRPELEEMASLVEAARNDVEVAARQTRPVIDLFANYGAETDQFGNQDLLYGWTAGVRLDWPIIDGGDAKGVFIQRAARHRQLQHQQESLNLAIAGEVRQAFYDYQEARSILQATELVIEQAEEALRLARNRYEAGRGTQLDVLESQLQLTRSRLENATAANSFERSLVRIKRAMGASLAP